MITIVALQALLLLLAAGYIWHLHNKIPDQLIMETAQHVPVPEYLDLDLIRQEAERYEATQAIQRVLLEGGHGVTLLYAKNEPGDTDPDHLRYVMATGEAAAVEDVGYDPATAVGPKQLLTDSYGPRAWDLYRELYAEALQGRVARRGDYFGNKRIYFMVTCVPVESGIVVLGIAEEPFDKDYKSEAEYFPGA